MTDTAGERMRITKFQEKLLEVFYVQFDRHYTKDAIKDAFRKLRSIDQLLMAISVSLRLSISLDEASEVLNVHMES